MARVVVLGGCGVVGSVAVRTLAAQDSISTIVVADKSPEKAIDLRQRLNSPKIEVSRLDVLDGSALRDLIRGADVVLNCVGPFYSTVEKVVDAVIESCVNYVDVCDDVDATLALLKRDSLARQRGLKILIGMGSSPGATNLLARLAHDTLLDETIGVDIFHTHGGEPEEGEGVIAHRFHCMSIDIPVFIDGKLKYVGFFEPDGVALRQTFDFPLVGDRIPLYPYPHPEQITLPMHLRLSRVTNKGSVLPVEYFDLIMELCRLGLADKTPVPVRGTPVVPHDFAVAYVLAKRKEILAKAGFTSQRGCCSVIAEGVKDGRHVTYRFHMASRTEALGEGTGIPAAVGVILMLSGRIRGAGVMPPEACVDPFEFVEEVKRIMDLGKKPKDAESFGGVIVEMEDEAGRVTRVEI